MAPVNVDMSQLPKPAVIEQLDYEQILQEWLQRYKDIDPDYQNVSESDPVYKLLEVAAFREIVMRQRVNDAAHSSMLAYSQDEDLDNLGANFDVKRLVIDEGDPDAVPPRPRVMESNDAFRYRIQLSNRAKNTAGSADDYEFWALSADGLVKSIATDSPKGTLTVTVSVLSHEGNGTASPALQKRVEDALTPQGTRPLSDEVVVQSANINEFDVVAELELFPGPDGAEVEKAARQRLDEWLASSHRQGMDLTLDGFYAALRVSGVYKVHLASPAADIINDRFSAGHANTITLTSRVTT
ncbi:baseplate assembly protein [Enterovibrio norvegicus]|uniref:baseplate assembly protein n=1 Tax=Enterovibrio norvegicus TaxID=188144 RepID=UPI003551E7D6